jgi:hypothetical protein
MCVLVLCFAVSGANAQGDVLQYGDTVAGVIDDDSPEVAFEFEAQAGDMVTIALSATSGDLDTVLVLVDAAGAFVTSDDDSGEARNSLIQDFEITDAGTYRIIATRYDRELGDTSGEFTLSLSAQGGEAAPPADAGSSGEGEEPEPADTDPFGELPDLGAYVYTVLESGDAVEGEVTDDAWAVPYVFGGHAGDEVTLTVARTDGDLLLDVGLFDRTGAGLLAGAEDADDTGEVTFSHQLPETAYYVVGVRRVSGEAGETTGSFTFTFEAAGGAGEDAPEVEATAEPGGMVVEPTPVPADLPPAIDITLSWNTTADLDLILYYPPAEDAGAVTWESIYYENPLPEGVVMSGDGNGFCRELTEQASERIIWDAATAPTGAFEILVLYSLGCGSPVDPVPFELTYTVDGQTQTVSGTVGAPSTDAAEPLDEYRESFAR